MTHAEIVQEAKRRNLGAVRTFGGQVKVEDWQPYGLPDQWQGEWISATEVRDVVREGLVNMGVLGVWEFVS